MFPLLEVRDLTVKYAGYPAALTGITFEIRPGEVVGIVGESGSGKTTLGLAILRLLPANGRVVRGSIRFRERDLSALSEPEMHSLRGSEVAMIPQEPDLALNPFIRAVDQVEEVIRAHRDYSRERRRNESRRVLGELALNKPARLMSAYPHQLSGGERQRLVIAQAIACQPALLIADEPSIGLDVVLQSQWLALMKNLRERLGLAILLITHNPSILSGLADRVLVMYRGRIIEQASLGQLIAQPLHPYTRSLMSAVPGTRGATGRTKRLPAIPGIQTPQRSETGCPFESRCPDAMAACADSEPPDIIQDHQRHVRCLKYGQ
jgi:oligopeptide/dipeptide ABC transporter ATP-binding protein